MPEVTRLLQATTPLGEDVLLLAGFSGREEMSRLFTFHLDFGSDKDDIKAKDIVGKPVTWAVDNLHSAPRFFNGFVSRFTAGARAQRVRSYQAEVVPWLWFLTRTTNCRIFQNKTAQDIIKQVFD